MAKSRKSTGEGEQPRGLVPVIYARDQAEAESYKGLLVSNDIPAVIEEEAGETIGMPASVVGQGVPVLVPDELLDEASEIIAEHEDTQEEEELNEYEDLDGEADEELDEEFDDDDLDDDDLDDDLDDEDETDEADEDLGDDDLDDLDDDFDEEDVEEEPD